MRLRGEQLRETQLVLQRTNEQMDATVPAGARAGGDPGRRPGPQLAARARALYKLGELSLPAPAPLRGAAVGHAIRGYRFVSALARRDKERIAGFRADLDALAATRADLAARRRSRRWPCAPSSTAHAPRPGRRPPAEVGAADLARREEGVHAAYLQELEEAEGKLGAAPRRPGRGRRRRCPSPPSSGTLPWPVAGPRAHDLRPPQAPALRHLHRAQRDRDRGRRGHAGGRRARGHGGLRRPVPRLRPHGHGRPRRQAPHPLRPPRRRRGSRRGSRWPRASSWARWGRRASGGPGLYFEVRRRASPQDPLEWLDKRP